MAGTGKCTIEPVILLFFLSIFMSLYSIQDLIYAKVCYTQFSPDVCKNLYDKENESALNKVQSSSSHWIFASNLFLFLPSIVVAQILGSWADTYGVKIPMLMPPTGLIFSSFIYVGLSSYLTEWPLSLCLLAAFIGGISGSFSSCVLICLKYVTQISDEETRTARVSILEAMVFISGSSGPLLTGWIQESMGRSSVFITIMALQVINVIYIIIFVADIPPSQKDDPSRLSLFSFRHISESLATVGRRRDNSKRAFILLLMVAIAFFKLCVEGVIDTSYLYVKDKPMEWSLSSYTYYSSLKNGLNALSLLVILPQLKMFADTALLAFGLAVYSLGLITIGLAKSSAVMYASTLITAFNWALPLIRSMGSKLVESSEQGKLFACFAMVESICIMLGSFIFNTIYPVTRSWCHGFVFFMAAALLSVPVGIACYLRKKFKYCNEFASLVSEGTTSDVDEDQEEDVAP